MYWSGRMGNEAISLEKAKKQLEELGRRRFSEVIKHLSLEGLQIVQAQGGSILFNQILHKELADRAGSCHVGEIATIIDGVGTAAIAAYTGDVKVAVDFNISYFSTVKIQEEVEIEAKMVANRGELSLTKVEFRRKRDGKVIALGKQWTSQVTPN